MTEDGTTVEVQRYLDELAGVNGDASAEPIVGALLSRAASRLHILCGSLLTRSYPRLMRPPLSLQSEEMLSAVVERLLKAMREVRPTTVRQFFALANQHMRWELNDLARRLDKQQPFDELHESEARTGLLKQFGNTTDLRTAERAGRACLLLPGSEEETSKAVALVDRAASADPSSMDVPGYLPYFNVAKALADYRQGKYQSAVDRLQGSNATILVPLPQLILAMAHCCLGDISEANTLLSQAVRSFDWSKAHATDADAWIYHALRHEAEGLVAPRAEEKQ